MVLMASQKVCSPTWLTSTIMPRVFILFTSCFPKSVSPLCFNESPLVVSSAAEVAQSVELFQVNVKYLAPLLNKLSSLFKSFSIMCPPSTPSMAASFFSLTAVCNCCGVFTIIILSGFRRAHSYTESISLLANAKGLI